MLAEAKKGIPDGAHVMHGKVPLSMGWNVLLLQFLDDNREIVADLLRVDLPA
jgi:hypothetical protein